MELPPKLVNVVPQSGFRLDVEYNDGSRGSVDVSDLAGKGVFSEWETPGFFESVVIGSNGQLSWGDSIELCGDAVYLRLTGRSLEDALNALKSAEVDA